MLQLKQLGELGKDGVFKDSLIQLGVDMLRSLCAMETVLILFKVSISSKKLNDCISTINPDVYIVQGFRVVQVEECWFKSLAPLMAEVRAQMGSGPVYLSFDIDALDPGFAPGTGTPEIAGLTPIQVNTFIFILRIYYTCSTHNMQEDWNFHNMNTYFFFSRLDLGSRDYSRLPWSEPGWMWSSGGVSSLRHNRYYVSHFTCQIIYILFKSKHYLYIFFPQQGTLPWLVPISFTKCCASCQKLNTSNQYVYTEQKPCLQLIKVHQCQMSRLSCTMNE